MDSSDAYPPSRPAPHHPGAPVVALSLALVAAFGGWYLRGRLLDPEEVAAAASSATLAVADPVGARAVTPPGASRPDLVLVTVSSLRADHVGPLFGYGRATMPWLTDLSRRSGQTFRSATAASSWALPSAASALTGVSPSTHGLIRSPRPAPDGGIEVPLLADTVGTLAERLAKVGYQTWAVVADPALLGETGLARGFDDFTNLGFARAHRVQLQVERMGIDRRKVDKPLFAWIHYGDPSAPYQANPWAYLWGPLVPGAAAPSQELLTRLSRMALPEIAAAGSGAEPVLDSVHTLYDSELRLVDDHLQLLWGDLGLDDGDLVVIAGLHGEDLRDPTRLGHGGALGEDLLRVPLVLSWPERWAEPQRFARPVSLEDLMPTIAEAGGAPVPEGALGAVSLVSLIEGRGYRRPAPVRAELGSRCLALYEGSLKLVATGRNAYDLFDVEQDPREARRLTPDHPGARELTRLFLAEAWPPAPPRTASVQVSQGLRPQLAAGGSRVRGPCQD